MVENNKKVAVYIRFANKTQDKDLIQYQRIVLRDFAKQHGFYNLAEYIDNGYVGNTLDRPAFLEMEADIKAGRVYAVIAKSIDRISRNAPLAETWLESLKEHDVKFLSADGFHNCLVFTTSMIQESMRNWRKQKRQKQ